MPSQILQNEPEFPVFDLAVIDELYSILENDLFEICGHFCDQALEQVRQLQDTSEDPEVLLNTAHALKSTSGQFGLVHLSQMCQLLESALRNGQKDNLDEYVAAINVALAPALNALKGYLKSRH